MFEHLAPNLRSTNQFQGIYILNQPFDHALSNTWETRK